MSHGDKEIKKAELEKREEFYKLEKEVETLNRLLKKIDSWLDSYKEATTPRKKASRMAHGRIERIPIRKTGNDGKNFFRRLLC